MKKKSCLVLGCLTMSLGGAALVVAAIVFVTSLPPGFIPLGNQGDLKAKEGNRVIGAIEAYRAVSGSLPPSLADLTPRFLPHPADPKWEYHARPPHFSLAYYWGRARISFDSAHPEWMLNYEGSEGPLYR